MQQTLTAGRAKSWFARSTRFTLGECTVGSCGGCLALWGKERCICSTVHPRRRFPLRPRSTDKLIAQVSAVHAL